MRGLSEIGLAAHAVNAEPRRAVMRAAKAWALVIRGNRFGGLYAPEVRELRRLTARRRASPIERWDAAVQMGSDFGVPFPRKFVTYEDMTVRQMARLFPLERVLGASGVERWIAAQAKCYETALGCCVASRWAAESVIRDYEIDPAKVHVVGFGRNHEPAVVDRDWSRPRFLFVGYDWERKNGPMLLRAFARVREHAPSAQLDLVGGHGEVSAEGITTHGALDFSDRVQREHIRALFESATCFVMPSQWEPFGMAYIEAAAAGVPSIGTNVGGVSDIVGPDGGIIIDPSSEDALVEAMALLCDPERASKMGAYAAERSRHFTWSAVARRLARALQLPGDWSSPSLDLFPAPAR
jgi:glycogen synthase